MKKLFFTALVLIAFNPAASTAEKRGYISYRTCPYSCRTEGIEKSHCKDWREGNYCFIEDLSRPRQSDYRPPQSEQPVQRPPQQRPPQYNPDNGWGSSQPGGNQGNAGGCQNLSRYEMGQPRIDIGRVKPTGNVFDDKYKVSGTIEGRCLTEAFVLENGKRTQSIAVETTPQFRTFDFEVKVHTSEYPSIRVYNMAGNRDEQEVHADEGGGYGGR